MFQSAEGGVEARGAVQSGALMTDELAGRGIKLATVLQDCESQSSGLSDHQAEVISVSAIDWKKSVYKLAHANFTQSGLFNANLINREYRTRF